MADSLADTLKAIAAECLHLPAAQIDRHVPFARYGLDSLVTLELTAALERDLGLRLADTVLLDHPDLASLEQYLTSGDRGTPDTPHITELMSADSVLPADICPVSSSAAAGAAASVLLTGATGYLGSFLLASLLRDTESTVYCLARSAGGRGPRERIVTAMRKYGIWEEAFDTRIHAIEADLAAPLLGLDRARYESLADAIQAVYHAAATVNWVQPYSALRHTNVLGTTELLRLACRARQKHFHFISSVAVCYSTMGPREVGEEDDVHPYLRGIHLGYAQSKCVAEALACQAGDRGLPVTIFRPSLITGDQSPRAVKTDDLLSRMIKATILMGAAPDLDWGVDCCPVDYVADAVVALAANGRQQRFFHLVSPAPRHWRELVLWMNLYGYGVRIIPYKEWLELVMKESHAPDHPLRELRLFFSGEPAGEGGLTLPELYQDSIRSHVRGELTLRALQGHTVGNPTVGAELLDRYFQKYVERGFLPAGSNGSHRRHGKAHGPPEKELIRAALGEFLRREKLELLDMKKEQAGSEHSILAELTSWKYGSSAGLGRWRLEFADGGGAAKTLCVVVKRKACDRQVIDVAVQVAEQCSAEMGRAFSRHRRHIGLAGSHLREIGIYHQQDERLQRHVPALLGSHGKEAGGQWLLVLEDISDLDMIDSSVRADAWSPEKIGTAVRGLASLHSIWYGREDELLQQPWLGPVVSAEQRNRMGDLWSALGEHASHRFGSWAGRDMGELQRALTGAVGSRWQQLDSMPRTLIHNDFNSRNIALRHQGRQGRLCAYDWELATLGVPQHDLAEFLCFTAASGVDRNAVLGYLELHRTELEKAAQVHIDAHEWLTGFCLSLHDLLVDRLGMYAMVDRFRPQRFLPRVVSTWRHLYNLFPLEAA